ncbi:hypothetical protein [Catellatospora tritici]|uniref:hypothetical protein n=1 Tax=Catellatospora tritici TaxID=2851566 RepID=UPI001C2D2412|nr:hypothetical protein [Catellatospora tritici]MBV1851859.1 hypothetical protein [Catellatospora tritici]
MSPDARARLLLLAVLLIGSGGWFALSWGLMGTSPGDAAGEAAGAALGLLVLISVVGTVRRHRIR